MPGPSAAEMAEGLSRHGLPVEAAVRERGRRSAGEAMLEEAAAFGADLVFKGRLHQQPAAPDDPGRPDQPYPRRKHAPGLHGALRETNPRPPHGVPHAHIPSRFASGMPAAPSAAHAASAGSPLRPEQQRQPRIESLVPSLSKGTPAEMSCDVMEAFCCAPLRLAGYRIHTSAAVGLALSVAPAPEPGPSLDFSRPLRSLSLFCTGCGGAGSHGWTPARRPG